MAEKETRAVGITPACRVSAGQMARVFPQYSRRHQISGFGIKSVHLLRIDTCVEFLHYS